VVLTSQTAARYAGLAVAILATDYVLLATLYSAGLPLLLAKLLTELALVSTSYVVQARYIFADRAPVTLGDRASTRR
jgi:putative flippase GtrA